MKKSLLCSALLFCCLSGFSQSHFYMAFGYNLATAKMSGLNFVVDRYNDTRDPEALPTSNWQSFERMGSFNTPNGFCFSIGGSKNRALFDLSWVGRHMTRTAKGTQPNGDEATRQLKWRMNTFNMGLGIVFIKRPAARIGLGLSVDLGSEKVFTRVGTNGTFETEDFGTIQKDLIVGSTIFMHIILSGKTIPAGLFIRPYVQLPYLKSDFWDTNRAINPVTWSADDYEANKGNNMSFGVQLMIGLFRRDKD